MTGVPTRIAGSVRSVASAFRRRIEGRGRCVAAVALLIGCSVLAPAVSAQTRARAAAPVSATGSMSRAVTALYEGDTEMALRLATTRLQQDPRDVRALVVAARARLARGEPAPAYDLLVKALSIDARNPDVLYFLGVVSSDLATKELDRLQTMAPDNPRVHQLLGRSLKLQNKLAEAVAEYEVALRGDPKLLQALIELAEIYREEANCAEAAALYRRAEEVKPTYDGSYGLGACLAADGNHADAVEKFREALKHDSSAAIAYFGLGSSLLQLKDAAGAIAALNRAVALQPKMRQGFYLLGRAYAALGDTERSRQALARAVELAKTERAEDEAIFTKTPRTPQVPNER